MNNSHRVGFHIQEDMMTIWWLHVDFSSVCLDKYDPSVLLKSQFWIICIHQKWKINFLKWPRSVIHTNIHTQTRCYIKIWPPRREQRQQKQILQNIQVESDHQSISCSLYQQTDWQTDCQADRQAGSSCTGCMLIQPTGGTDISSCSSHPSKFFVQGNVWFQDALVLCSDQSKLFCLIVSPTANGQVLNAKKVAMVTSGCRWGGYLREPVQSAESLGDEVEESSAGVSPVPPVWRSILWETETEWRWSKYNTDMFDYSIFDLCRWVKMLKNARFLAKMTQKQLIQHNRLNHITATS